MGGYLVNNNITPEGCNGNCGVMARMDFSPGFLRVYFGNIIIRWKKLKYQ